MKSSKVLSSTIDAAKKITIKVLRLGKSDVQTSKQISPFGVDSAPIKDMVAIHSETSEKGKSIVIGYINKECIAKAGETRLYSTDASGNLKSTVYLTNDGKLELMGDSNFAVKFNELELAFNEMQIKFNAHIHPLSTGTSTPTATPSIANILLAKNDKIKTN